MNIWKLRKQVLKAAKIALGSSLAIFIAQYFHLNFAASAGTITLLSIVTTKWETIWLSLFRILSFFMSAILTMVIFHHVSEEWIAYGFFIFFIVMILNLMEWGATISVNAVIGIHFLTERNFSVDFIINEFYLVLIGVTIAILFNLFHGNEYHKSLIIEKMRHTEEELQSILRGLCSFLTIDSGGEEVWKQIKELEQDLSEYIVLAVEFQNNTFHSHPGYYIEYFEMRLRQLNLLRNMHTEMQRIKTMPVQAKTILEYIRYLTPYVIEHNHPKEQLDRLQEIFEEMRREKLPVTRDEFEARSLLYVILIALEDFLLCKKRFIEGMTEKQKRLYWKDAVIPKE